MIPSWSNSITSVYGVVVNITMVKSRLAWVFYQASF